ncbi:DNA-methyltransferase [Amycolatopsis sp. CA-161197]|uniref:DNA-methyltransferase n=1 Tax=Amycolatopsis sp. CA-161197 TaxID=3239922 RepID=UPI003D91E4A7
MILQADARALPLADDSVDLVVTSPPYYMQRSYTDGGRHYDGQIGVEPTVTAYLDALLHATRECIRVLKPTGSIWINLGDKYATRGSSTRAARRDGLNDNDHTRHRPGMNRGGVPEKSLLGLPWRYAIRCVDELGLTLRAEVIWSKPNGLPESVTDRVRRSHEQWFHFTLTPRYYSAVDDIRELYNGDRALSRRIKHPGSGKHEQRAAWTKQHSRGRIPGSVWEVPTQPLTVPADLEVDHFAAFPMELPRRLIRGWSPREVCARCGAGRGPRVAAQGIGDRQPAVLGARRGEDLHPDTSGIENRRHRTARHPGSARCACPDATAPTTPGVVLDPFGGTGTTALVAAMLGRTGVSVDASADYCRLAEWRARDPRQRAKAAAHRSPHTTSGPHPPDVAGAQRRPPHHPRREP